MVSLLLELTAPSERRWIIGQPVNGRSTSSDAGCAAVRLRHMCMRPKRP